MITPLEKAIEMLGGQVALAKAVRDWCAERKIECRVQQAHVWNWVNKQKSVVPAEYVIAIADICAWRIRPNQLRPDLYPHPQDGLPDHLRDTHQAAA